jgi:hypothetical protein
MSRRCRSALSLREANARDTVCTSRRGAWRMEGPSCTLARTNARMIPAGMSGDGHGALA